MKLLAVDDDVVTHMMLGMELEGVELLEATGVHDGFKRATQDDPDGVVIDLRLPDGDGLDLVRKLRHQIGINQIPIVVLTAAHDPAQEAAVISAGADVYMAKPFDPRDVEATVEAIIRIPAASRRSRRRRSVSLLREHRPLPPLVDEARAPSPTASQRQTGDVLAPQGREGGDGKARRWWRRSDR